MNPDLLKAMRPKKKRAVNPDIPRPNLFTHEKRLKDMQGVHDSAMRHIRELEGKVRRLENQLSNQTSYLQALHIRLHGRR